MSETSRRATMKVPMVQFAVLLALFVTLFRNAPTASAQGGSTSPDIEKIFHFNIEYANVTVNCETKEIVTVNGMYPGPTIYANEGDRIIVNVTNNVHSNITVHFHGTRQERTTWMDGVAGVTMCPIMADDYFLHNFTIPRQKGTLIWHAHYNWERATVHGAFVTYPKYPDPFPSPFAGPQLPYPFPKPDVELDPIIIGEWWYDNIEDIEIEGLKTGRRFPEADVMTINGKAGPLYNCSVQEGVTTFKVTTGKTYLLRIVNAALNTQVFFAIEGHILTVVEADAAYVYPFDAGYIFVGPGQTTNVLVNANHAKGTFTMTVSGYGRTDYPTIRPVALFQYDDPGVDTGVVNMPKFPAYNESGALFAYESSLRTLYPGRVPLTVNQELLLVTGLSFRTCDATQNCSTDPVGLRNQGMINNITFLAPTISLLEAWYDNITGVYTEDFPQHPENPFDWTGPASPPPYGRISDAGTRIIPVKFNDTVQIILQDTNILGFENHPFHLHGHNFYVIGMGFGNYNNYSDPFSFNLYDPPLRNTVGVPYAGWVALRLKANNPGMWLFHCHLDKHTSWGMQAVFHVSEGPTEEYQSLPPPEHRVPCLRP